MLKKILVPLDGSEMSELALVYAKELAIATKLEVQLACATDRQDEPTLRMCGLYLEKVAERLRTQVTRANPTSVVKTVIVDGNPGDAVVVYCEKEGIDLLIMMSHGGSGIMPWAMGSTANKIIQRCQVPVLMVRASKAVSKKRPVQVFKKILLPLDGSPFGEAALELTKTLAQVLKSEVILFSVVETVQHIHTIGGPDHFVYTEQQVELMKKGAMQYLEKIRGQFVDDKVTVVLRSGDPAQEIIKLSREENVNMVAMSSHGKSGITRWVMGSISNKVLHAGTTPILLVRPKKVPE
jgi:nucleotide-binding universal stress UspA family protein